MIGWQLIFWTVLLCAAQEPKAPAPPDAVYILGQDLKQLLQGPDAIILTGEEAKKYLDAAKTGSSRTASALECQIRGEPRGELAQLTIQVVASSDSDAPQPLPLGLAETRWLARATTDGQPARLSKDEQGLVVWIEGKGQHTVVLDVQLPLAGSPNLPALVSSIPEAPVTRFEFKLPRPVADVKFNPATPVQLGPVDAAKAQVVSATLGARKKLDMQWHWGDQPIAQPVPLAVSEVVATVEPGTVRIDTDLRLQLRLGTRRVWELRIGAEERVLDVQSGDGSPVQWQARAESGGQIVTVQFAAPVSGVAELSLSTEMPWSGEELTLRGPELLGAFSHRSVVALRASPELDVAVTARENARRADALPASLRSPRNQGQFVSVAQPYQLKLSVLQRRPRTSVRTTALVSLVGDKAIVAARWQFAVHGGKLAQIAFALPAPFEPSDITLQDADQPIRLEEAGDTRIARVFLNGTDDEFAVHLRATVPLVLARNLAKLDLPRPLDVRSELSRLYLSHSSELALEPTPDLEAIAEPPDPDFAQDLVVQPTVRGFQTTALLERVAFRTIRLVPQLRHQTTARVDVRPDHLAVSQTFDYAVRGGRVSQMRLAVPEVVRASLELLAPAGREPSFAESGDLIIPIDETAATPRVELNYRLLLEPSEPSGTPQSVRVPLVRAQDGSCQSTRVTVSAPWTMDVETQDPGWRSVARRAEPDATARHELIQLRAADALTLVIAARTPAMSPQIVVDRALIESVVEPGGECQTRARYRLATTTAQTIRIRVPPRSRVTGLWLGKTSLLGRTAADAITRDLLLDVAGVAMPAVLEIDCNGSLPADGRFLIAHELHAPLLVGDVAWGRVFWQLTMPESLVVLRGPPGYSDENRLRWAGTTLQFQPRLDRPSLERWLSGAGDSARPAISDTQTHLWGRLLTVEPLSVTTVSRAWLVLICSGSVLLGGVLLVAAPLRAKSAIVLFGLVGVLIALALEPATALQCVRSAGIGVLLVLIAALFHRWLRRRQARRRSVFPEPGVLAKAKGSSLRPGSSPRQPALPPAAAGEVAGPSGAEHRLAAPSSSLR